MPLHVTGSGVDTDPTNSAFTVRPHASVIGAGAPGLLASAGSDAVGVGLAGAVWSTL